LTIDFSGICETLEFFFHICDDVIDMTWIFTTRYGKVKPTHVRC